MRTIRADARDLQFLAADIEARPVLDYEADNRAQKRDDAGRLLWSLGVFVIAPDGADKHAVKFAADVQPTGFRLMGPVVIDELLVTPYLNNGRVALSFRAASVAPAAQPKSAG